MLGARACLWFDDLACGDVRVLNGAPGFAWTASPWIGVRREDSFVDVCFFCGFLAICLRASFSAMTGDHASRCRGTPTPPWSKSSGVTQVLVYALPSTLECKSWPSCNTLRENRLQSSSTQVRLQTSTRASGGKAMHRIAALSSCSTPAVRAGGSRSSGKVGPFLSSLALALCLLAVVAKGADLQTKYRFAILAQPLDTALLAFSEQSKIQVLMSAKPQLHASSPGVTGALTARAALAAILDDTGFAFKEIDHETVAIIAVSGDPQGSTGFGVGATAIPVMHLEQSAPTNAETTEQPTGNLQEIVIQGYKFLNADTSGTTNLPLPIEKVPQAISLISGDFIKAADLRTYGDVASYTPGVVNVGNQNGYTTLIKIRGFSGGRAVDGLSILSNSPTDLDPTVVDRLEVVKGPSSVVYGISSAGGLVNTVTKSATPDTPNYLFVQASQWYGFRLEGQVAGALDSEGHVRVIGAFSRDTGDSFLNNLSHSTSSFYGGIDAAVTNSVTVSLHAGNTLFIRTGFDGVPFLPDGSPAGLPISFCVCVKDFDTRDSTYWASGNVTWHPTSMLELSVKGYFENLNNSGSGNPYSYGLQPGGIVSLSTQQNLSGTAVNYAFGGTAIYHLDDLGLAGSFLSLGLHREDYTFDGTGVSYQANLITANVYEGQQAFDQAIESVRPLMIYNPFTGPRLTTATTEDVQAVIQLTNPLTLLVGGSYSKVYSSSTTEGVYSAFPFPGKASYRAGLTYQIAQPLNAYLSYSQSFEPQTYYEPNFIPVPPLIGKQYEAGLKYTNHRVLVTGAVYQLTQANAAQYFESINNADFYLPIGEVTHKGVELEAVGQIADNWKIDAGYSYLDPKITTDSTASLVGQTELYLPTQTASAYLVYTFNEGAARGLSLGGGERFVSSVRTAYTTDTPVTFDIPGYYLTDLTAGYARDKWLWNFNIHNVFNKHYWINSWQTLYYGNVPGAPLNLSLSVRREF